MMTPTQKGSGSRIVRNALLLFVAACVAYYVFICGQIVRHARNDEARKSDVIIVFGAAEYYGKPSPVFRARLDHGFELFRRGLAPMIITTGGAGGEEHFSEGQVGRDYLISKGIRDFDLIAETQSSDTAQSAERVSTIMRTNGMKTCVAVSDRFHLFRIKRMLQAQGIQAYVSPRPELPKTKSESGLFVLREALSYILWRANLT
jgi:uncharacterized SAM-binding protein YcdF (DUF218 family)